MNQLTRSKIKDGNLIIPFSIRKFWRNKEVVILPEKNRLIVQPLEPEWDQYEQKIAKGCKKIPAKLINEATRQAKQ